MPDAFMHKLKVYRLGIEPSEILSYMAPGDIADKDYFEDIAQTELNRIGNETVQYGYVVASAGLDERLLKINNTIFDVGTDVSLMLQSVEKTVVFVCTVGKKLNELIEKTDFRKNYLEAYILDIIGTVVIGKTLEMLHDEIKNRYSPLYKVTNTISPGNCGWPVEEQEKLLSILPEGFLDIRLNSSGMMYPAKTISGLMGIGSKVKFKQTECRHCRSRNCPYRKEEYVA